MNKRMLVYTSTILVTIFLVMAYLLFNLLGITESRIKKYELTIVTEKS